MVQEMGITPLIPPLLYLNIVQLLCASATPMEKWKHQHMHLGKYKDEY